VQACLVSAGSVAVTMRETHLNASIYEVEKSLLG